MIFFSKNTTEMSMMGARTTTHLRVANNTTGDDKGVVKAPMCLKMRIIVPRHLNSLYLMVVSCLIFYIKI